MDFVRELNTNIESSKFERIQYATDPGAYLTGNYTGWCEETGVQSAWLQFDSGVFQGQIKIANGTHKMCCRCKISSQNWNGINWSNVN